MKTLFAIIAAASLVVGCGVFEEEQTTTDAKSGSTTITEEIRATAKSVSTGGHHTCAIKADDTLECWGYDGYGQSTVPADFQ